MSPVRSPSWYRLAFDAAWAGAFSALLMVQGSRWLAWPAAWLSGACAASAFDKWADQ